MPDRGELADRLGYTSALLGLVALAMWVVVASARPLPPPRETFSGRGDALTEEGEVMACMPVQKEIAQVGEMCGYDALIRYAGDKVNVRKNLTFRADGSDSDAPPHFLFGKEDLGEDVSQTRVVLNRPGSADASGGAVRQAVQVWRDSCRGEVKNRRADDEAGCRTGSGELAHEMRGDGSVVHTGTFQAPQLCLGDTCIDDAMLVMLLARPKVGPRGPTGARGARGDRGARGAGGEGGARGPRGPSGNTGSRGPRGPRGAQGMRGPGGDRGAPPRPAMPISSNRRCGPTYGTRCRPGQCCSVFGWCASGSAHCGWAKRKDSQYHGDGRQ